MLGNIMRPCVLFSCNKRLSVILGLDLAGSAVLWIVWLAIF